jgi:ATP synthase protein I
MKPARQKNDSNSMLEQVGAKAERKLRARRQPDAGLWFGLGMMGLVGWSIAIPTLLGAALGMWLDKHYDDQRSWTLALLLAGLVIGCFTAWNWLTKERKAMDHKQGEKQ